MRLALSCWGIFVASSAALLAITVALYQGKTTETIPSNGPGGAGPSPVSVTISRLRRKLGDPPAIETIANVGYRIVG